MGVLVVSSDARGCRDVVRNGVDGLILQDTCVDALSGAIKSLMASPQKLEAMKQAALMRRDYFDRKHFIAEMFNAMNC